MGFFLKFKMRMSSAIRNILLFLLFFISLWPYHYVQGFDKVHIPIAVVHFFPELLIVFLGMWILLGQKQNTIPFGLTGIIFFIFVLVGSLGGAYWGAYVARAVNYFGISLLLCWITALHVNKVRDFHLFACTIGIIVILVSGYGILEFILKRNLLFEQLFSPENPIFFRFLRGDVSKQFRVYGTLGSPVYLGTFLMMCLPCCWYLFFSCKEKMIRFIGGLSTLTGCVALLFTFSRGAWIGTCVAAVVYLVIRKIRLRVLGVILLGVGGGALAVAGGTDFGRLAIDRGLFDEFREYRSHGRTLAYMQATQMAALSPFLGNGIGSYRSLAPKFNDDDHTPDNMYLRLFAETGIGGLVVFVLFYIQTLTQIAAQMDIKRQLPDLDQRIAQVFFVTLIGFAINLLFCDALYFPPTRILFWIFMGLCFGFLNQQKTTETAGVCV